jgi:SAM-dependent methyltransferase
MRLQYLVMEKLRKRIPLSDFSVYHFSPEKALSIYFKEIFGSYYSAGITTDAVDYPADLTALPFSDRSCDFIFASHILEHIQDDKKALTEIERVLGPGGIAVLPVPVVEEMTVEYPEPNPNESDHVRAPGLDYFERYKDIFSKVEVFSSEDFDSKFQLWIYEDRRQFPTKNRPLRRPMPGERHPDYVPVCFAQN